jgi:hypothetical protein
MSPLLPLSCSRCPASLTVFVRTVNGALCASCWHALREPGAHPSTMQETHQAEIRTRDVMQRRGGTSRHLVRAGLS